MLQPHAEDAELRAHRFPAAVAVNSPDDLPSRVGGIVFRTGSVLREQLTHALLEQQRYPEEVAVARRDITDAVANAEAAVASIEGRMSALASASPNVRAGGSPAVRGVWPPPFTLALPDDVTGAPGSRSEALCVSGLLLRLNEAWLRATGVLAQLRRLERAISSVYSLAAAAAAARGQHAADGVGAAPAADGAGAAPAGDGAGAAPAGGGAGAAPAGGGAGAAPAGGGAGAAGAARNLFSPFVVFPVAAPGAPAAAGGGGAGAGAGGAGAAAGRAGAAAAAAAAGAAAAAAGPWQPPATLGPLLQRAVPGVLPAIRLRVDRLGRAAGARAEARTWMLNGRRSPTSWARLALDPEHLPPRPAVGAGAQAAEPEGADDDADGDAAGEPEGDGGASEGDARSFLTADEGAGDDDFFAGGRGAGPGSDDDSDGLSESRSAGSPGPVDDDAAMDAA